MAIVRRCRGALVLGASVALVLIPHAVYSQAQLIVDSGHKLLAESRSEEASGRDLDVASLRFCDMRGNAVYVDQLLEEGPVVFAFLSTKCPLAKRYTMRLNRLHEQFSARGLTMVGVYCNADETREGILQYVEQAQFAFPVAKDVHGYLVRRIGATMTPQVFLIDQQKTLRYRGGIDDNRYETRVKQHWLRDAIEAVLASKQVVTAATKTLGCTVHLPAVETTGQVTYTTHVARILQDNCQTCHRAGQVAPFSLAGYEQARMWAQEIKAYTQSRLMPPWKAEPGYGELKGAKRLSDDELTRIARWVDDDAPEGPAEDLPPTPQFNDQWALGEPDLIVQMRQPYRIGPEGEDDYRHFIIPVQRERDRFIEAIDVQPGNRQTVHHVIAYVDTSGKVRQLDEADPGPGYTRFGDVGFQPASVLGGWAPGQMPSVLPPGTGRWLPQECDIVLQVHYFRTGVWEEDRTRIGLYFSKSEKPVAARSGVAINRDFVIPPGEKRYRVEGSSRRLQEPVYLISVYPHMHLLGQEIKVTGIQPDGQELPLVWIKQWDFNWQTPYMFQRLLFLPAGSRVKVVSHFDNSASNPNNPHDPPRAVGWGEKTTDEMCLSFFTYVRATEYTPGQVPAPVARARLPVTSPAD